MSSIKSSRSIKFWLVVTAAAVGLILLSYSQTFRNFFDWANGWAKDVISDNPLEGALVFFLFSMISAMLAFASSAVLVPAANLVWGKFPTFLLLWGGWLAGAMAAFGIGSLARPLVVRLGYQESLSRYQEYVSRRMRFWMVLLFCFAVPSEIPGYVLGGVHYSFRKFLAAIAITEAIYALGLVFAGDSLLRARRLPLMIIVGALIVIGFGASILFRKFRKRRSRQTSEVGGQTSDVAKQRSEVRNQTSEVRDQRSESA